MPHSSFLRNHGKTARSPRRPFEKERLDNEMKLIGEFGLKNKREVWRVGLAMARIRKAARILLTLDEKDPKRMFEGSALLRCGPTLTPPPPCAPFRAVSRQWSHRSPWIICVSPPYACHHSLLGRGSTAPPRAMCTWSESLITTPNACHHSLSLRRSDVHLG